MVLCLTTSVILPKIPEVLKVKWKGPFPFLPTGIFRTTSGCGPEYSGRNVPIEICCSMLTNRFIALLLFTYEGNSERAGIKKV